MCQQFFNLFSVKVSAMGSVIGIPVEEVWEAYGGFLIQFTMETGWNELLRALSPDLEVH